MTLENVKIWLQKKLKSVRMRRHFLELIRPRRSRSPTENMNSSHQIQNEFPGNCVVYIFIGGKPDHLSDLSYAILVALIVIHATTCPFTILLNLLVMIAVKTKTRLQSMSNMALACLALTDVMVGLVVQPLFIAQIWNIIQGETTASACSIQFASRFFFYFFCLSSIVHLFLITLDRCIAIMRPYTYIQTITKARVLIATALAWTLTLIINTMWLIHVEMVRAILTAIGISLIAIVFFCNIIVYREAHRQEKQIAAQQIFLSHKRVFKLTLIIITLIVISYFPVIIFVRLKKPMKNVVSLGTLTCIFIVVGSLASFNSLVNPFIYCIRLRQFRVAFIELLIRKNHNEADKLESKILGSAAINFESNPRGEREEQNTNQANAIRGVEIYLGGEGGEQHANQGNVIKYLETSQG